MTIFLSIASDGRWFYSLVSSIEHPIRTESDVRSMESHGTCYVEIPLVYLFTEYREKICHFYNGFVVVVYRVMEIIHPII